MGLLDTAFETWQSANLPEIHCCRLPSVRRELRYCFTGLTPCLEIALSERALSVLVIINGEYWDIVFDAEVVVFRDSNGFQCRICRDGGGSRCFPKVEELWIDHFFQPFGNWVSDVLLPAHYLCLFGESGRTTSAQLCAVRSTKSTLSLPIRHLM